MPTDRLALALEQMGAGDWLTFEKFAAEFLAVDFPSLRTMAASSGDKGRDGQLYQPSEEPTTAVQYSVAHTWKQKIQQTRARLNDTMPRVRRLIYCTNQNIGPAADSLVEECRSSGLSLDIRDASWFIARELSAPQRAVASEELAERYVTPLLARRGLVERGPLTLSATDARVALVHLVLEGYDAKTNKGLTKSCFEALVLASLHDTDSTRALSAGEICAAVHKFLPAADRQQLDAHVASALTRLSVRAGPVKQVGKTDQYHLSFEEQQRISDQAAELLLRESALRGQVADALRSLDSLDEGQIAEAAAALSSGIQRVLLLRGETFASAVATGAVTNVDAAAVLGVITELGTPLPELSAEAAAAVVLNVLEDPTPETRDYLRSIADGYTLFAFLRQTPDVQRVLVNVFSDGDIWLDTTVVLPLFAEILLEDPAERHHTLLLRAARDAGFRLFVTGGIIEELERHINRALQFARTGTREWQGGVPFLYAAYTLSGRARGAFVTWLEEFRGDLTPEDDIEQLLSEEFGIAKRNLEEFASRAEPELRAAVQEVWHGAHERRRGDNRSDLTPAVTLRLVAHDVENCLGVIQLRKQSAQSPMGYRAWWLTLDRTAYRLQQELAERVSGAAPPSPALSPDFLTELLRLGPLRSAIEREHHVGLPVICDFGRFEAFPKALVDLADDIRRRLADQSERVIARNVRDELNKAKWRIGDDAISGIRGAEERVRARLRAQSVAR